MNKYSLFHNANYHYYLGEIVNPAIPYNEPAEKVSMATCWTHLWTTKVGVRVWDNVDYIL